MSASCAVKTNVDPILNPLVAQKLMLDLRYFCDDVNTTKTCRTPVTELPQLLVDMISDTGIGGVILFAENLQNTPQILTLHYALQQAAKSPGHPPLFIAIDQDGGRVVRMPQNSDPLFAGPMPLCTPLPQH